MDTVVGKYKRPQGWYRRRLICGASCTMGRLAVSRHGYEKTKWAWMSHVPCFWVRSEDNLINTSCVSSCRFHTTLNTWMFAIATYQTIVPLKIRLIGDIIEPRDLGSCSIVPIEDLSSLVSLWDFGYLRLQFLRKHTVQNKNHGSVVQNKNTRLEWVGKYSQFWLGVENPHYSHQNMGGHCFEMHIC